jgi:hypothetical protein
VRLDYEDATVTNLLMTAPFWLTLFGVVLVTCGGWVWRLGRREPPPRELANLAPALAFYPVVGGVLCIVIAIARF